MINDKEEPLDRKVSKSEKMYKALFEGASDAILVEKYGLRIKSQEIILKNIDNLL